MNGCDRAEMDPLIQFFKETMEIIGDFFFFFLNKIHFIEGFGGLFFQAERTGSLNGEVFMQNIANWQSPIYKFKDTY